jgi:ADP-ribosyl-[dinitrogen reductase] hydrolase
MQQIYTNESNVTTPQRVIEHARASYLGLAIGDALGATTEFMTSHEIKAKYKVHKKVIGGGWLYLIPGQVTDDTEMSLAIGRAILQKGTWDKEEIAKQFLKWMRSKPADIGATCRRGIRHYMLHGRTEVPYNDWDAGNGAAMRMAPVALFSLGNIHGLKKFAYEQAHLTHNHPLSDAACYAIGQMVQHGLLGSDRFKLHQITRDLVAEHPCFRFNRYQGRAGAYVVETLQTVCHFFFSTSTFEECLVGVVNQGGDADTTGAIAGMIAGAYYGMEAIPKRWLRKLNSKVRLEIEDQAFQLITISPWAKEHPLI